MGETGKIFFYAKKKKGDKITKIDFIHFVFFKSPNLSLSSVRDKSHKIAR